jgi:hypothetical protein
MFKLFEKCAVNIRHRNLVEETGLGGLSMNEGTVQITLGNKI